MIIEEKNIIDEYRILKKKIGEGTWGTVHLAEDAEGSKVALKFLDGKKLLKECGLVDDQATLHFFKEKKGAFKEEYKNLKKLLHPNVAGAYRLGYFNEELYIASEYIDGKSLYEATRGMKPEDMIPLFLQGLLGLEAIHRHGLLHLDIKSGNVLLSKSGNVKIIDFGFSTLMEALKISICGSLPYMAPEVLFQKREFVGAQSDLYSFGCMMYRCLTGAYPYPQREHMEFDVESAKDVVKKEARPVPPSQMHIKVPKYLDQIILRLIVNDYHGRFYGGNVRAVINALATKQPENFREGVASRAAYLIPAGDEHIGRDEVKKILFKSVDDLRKGVQPAAPIFIISGEKGIGKTHLLQKVVNYAGEHVEETGICYLSLPTDDDRIEDWINKVNLEIGSAMRPVILTIDNAQYLLSEEGPAFKKAAGVLNNILDLLTERIKSSSLLAGVPPIIAILTLSENSYDKFKGQFNCFQLKRFTKEQIKTYLEKTPAFKNTDIPEKWVDTLLTSTDGVPGRLADRLRSYDSHGLFMELDTDMHLISENVIMPGERDLPSSIEEHLDRIYDNLSVYEKEVIDLISVWSFKDLTDAPKFADIYRYCSRLNLGQILNGLIKKNIIRLDPKSSSYLFYDEAFARRHFYEKIDVKRRMGIHGTIAANMEKYSDAYLVHHGMAGNSITNIVSIIRLGERLMCKEGKIQTARELFLHACENTSDMSNNLPSYINYLISKTCFLNGEFSRAIKYCEDGLNLCDKTVSKYFNFRLRLILIAALIEQRDLDGAEKLLDEIVCELKKDRFQPLHITAENYRAKIFLVRSHLETARANDYLAMARDLYLQNESLESELRKKNGPMITNNEAGHVLYSLGDYSLSAEKLVTRIDFYKRVGDFFSALPDLYMLTNAYRMARRYEEALDAGRLLIEYAQQSRSAKWFFYAHIALAGVLHDMKNYKDALREYTSCIVSGKILADELRDNESVVSAMINKGHVLKEMGDYASALIHFDAVLREEPEGFYLAYAYLGIGEVYYCKQQYGRVEKYFKRAEDIFKKLPPKTGQPYLSEINRLRMKLM